MIFKILFGITYLILMLVLYIVYLHNFIQKLRGKSDYLKYVIIDTGETGAMIFKSGTINRISNMPHTYVRSKVKNGILYFRSNEVEPLELQQSLSDYKYFCDTKEFDIISKSDILQTLLVFRTKQTLLVALVIISVLIILSFVISIFYAHTNYNALISQISMINSSVGNNPVVVT